MTIRLFGALLCGAALILATQTDPAQATTVKSSKSNTSDRMGGGGGKGVASRAKSNTSDRKGGVVQGPPMGGMIFFGRRRF
jgi:hypothetical protein